MLVPVYDRPSVAEPTETQDRAVMESRSATVHRKMPMPARQLPITESAHKAAVVGDGRVTAGVVLAPRDMPAESRGAAALDRAHHLQPVEAHVTVVGKTPHGPVVAEDIRDLQSWPGHGTHYAGGASIRFGKRGVSRSSGLMTS